MNNLFKKNRYLAVRRLVVFLVILTLPGCFGKTQPPVSDPQQTTSPSTTEPLPVESTDDGATVLTTPITIGSNSSSNPSSGASARRAALFTVGGDEYLGVLLSVSETDVAFVVDNADGVRRFPSATVQRIELQTRRQFDDINRLDQITDPVLRAAIENKANPADYPKSEIAYLNEITDATWTDESNSTLTYRQIFQVLNEAGKRSAFGSFNFNKDTETIEILHALTVTADGRVLHLSDDALKIEALYGSTPKYDRLWRLRYTLKEVQPGAIIDIAMRKVSKTSCPLETPFLESRFRDRAPTLRQSVVLTFPLDKADSIRRRLQPCIDGETTNVIMSETVENGQCVLTWSLSQPAEPVIAEPMMPNINDIAPRLLAMWQSSSISMSAEPDWISGVASDYRQLFDSLLTDADETAIRPIADQITESARADIRTLIEENRLPGGDAAETAAYQRRASELAYDYVARRVGLSGPTMSNFRPAPLAAAQTLTDGSGNHLDKCFLLARLLTAAGLEDVDIVFARTMDNGKFIPDIPHAAQFNGCCVRLRDTETYLYPSDSKRRYGELPSSLQGAAGLAVPVGRETGAGLLTIPLRPIETEETLTKMDIRVKADGGIEIDSARYSVGEPAVGLRRLANLSVVELDKTMRERIANIASGATMLNYAVSDFDACNEREFIAYKYRADEYCIRAGTTGLALKIPELESLSSQDSNAATLPADMRAHPLKFNSRERQRFEITLTAPDGYKIAAAPETVERAAEGYSFKATAALNEMTDGQSHTLTLTIIYERNAQFLDRDRYADFKAFRDFVSFWMRQWTVIEKLPGVD